VLLFGVAPTILLLLNALIKLRCNRAVRTRPTPSEIVIVLIRGNSVGARLLLSLLAASSSWASSDRFPDDLFGYSETPQAAIEAFPQWADALERHLLTGLPQGDCESSRLNQCKLHAWRDYVASLAALPRREQIAAVNAYANRQAYILDLDNYGIEDYWAIPREFLFNGGDCEDYAIAKLLSLRWLGFNPAALRIVVLQDTNLRVPHAVLAVAADDEILILDNQIRQVVRHRDIVHYAPVYSINEQRWWLHTPR
jgi:predicted transglutaminase-like cysteine proteinase